WQPGSDDCTDIGIDAASQHYARQDSQGGLTICRLADNREEVLARLPPTGKPPFGGPLMSPNGRFVAYGHSMLQHTVFAGVRVWRLDGPEPAVVPLEEPTELSLRALAFQSSGRHLAIGHNDRTVSIYDLATG